MKLLLDENLSESLCNLLGDIFDEVRHVRDLGMQGATDDIVWNYALNGNYAVISKDSDFVERSIISDDKIKVIWIRLGNCSTANVHLLLRNKKHEIETFLNSEDSVLELP